MHSFTDEKSTLKHAYLPNEQPTFNYTSCHNPFGRARRIFLLVLIILLPLSLLVKYFDISTARAAIYTTADAALVRHPHSSNSQITIVSHSNQSILVPLEAHIMSKCPDARDCLRDLVVPAMEKISDHVSFRLSFIGRYGRSSEFDGLTFPDCDRTLSLRHPVVSMRTILFTASMAQPNVWAICSRSAQTICIRTTRSYPSALPTVWYLHTPAYRVGISLNLVP